ncbi:MAG: hypothetical protein HY040_21350 [Planctomycetes bacterium]|nr:hypothetical protein [Planctomycetota bacterium]
MAGLRKPGKRDGSNPSTILVIFLSFFVLLSIGLGVWGYFGYSGQEKLREEAKAKSQLAKSNNTGEQYALTLAREARLAYGDALDPDEMNLYKLAIDDLLSDGGEFGKQDAKVREAAKKMVAEMRKSLNYDKEGKKYKETFKDSFTTLNKSLEDARAQVNTAQADYKALNERYEKLEAATNKSWKDANVAITDGNNKTLKAAQAQTEEMQKQMKRNQDLNDEKKQQSDQLENDKAKYEAVIRNLNKKIVAFEVQKADPNAPVKLAGDVHALMLDMSPGKTLWDNPLGKVTRVDIENGQLFVNIGAAQGAKPGLSFNIFADNGKRQATGQMKGTCEVIRVLDNASVCRITSLYDLEGREIVLADASKGRLARESENALKEGDLLFNMFWGSHVAVVGNVNPNGQPADTPAEQTRNLNAFMQILQNNGVRVDAYLDLTDNTIKGELNYRTRYLILGDLLPEPKNGDAFKPKQKDKDAEGKDGEAKQGEAKEAEAKEARDDTPDRAKAINETMRAMRKDAIERGMFIISAENFLGVIGHRRSRSANDLGASSFRPSVMHAGQDASQLQLGGGKKLDEVK